MADIEGRERLQNLIGDDYRLQWIIGHGGMSTVWLADDTVHDREVALKILEEVLDILSAQDDFSNDALFEVLKAYGKDKGYKVGTVMWPIRTAVSGRQTTPAGATEIMEILGKEESLARIRAGIDKLANA